jgi:hypothetical protein
MEVEFLTNEWLEVHKRNALEYIERIDKEITKRKIKLKWEWNF